MNNVYVVDTNGLISYFDNVFNLDKTVSREGLKIIDRGFEGMEIKLIFPNAVFIEIFNKWFRNEELAAKIKYEVYQRIRNQENMEIRSFDQETMENFIKIVDIEPDYKFDNHDKQVYAAAMTMQCPLITSDTKLMRYNNRKRFLPRIIS